MSDIDDEMQGAEWTCCPVCDGLLNADGDCRRCIPSQVAFMEAIAGATPNEAPHFNVPRLGIFCACGKPGCPTKLPPVES